MSCTRKLVLPAGIAAINEKKWQPWLIADQRAVGASRRPFHPFASVIEERIASEVSLYGVCPAARLGAWL
jgi:hypothetical protein